MIKTRKFISVIVLVAGIMNVTGCFTIRIGGKAELAPSTEEGTKIAQKRCWYALWGLLPIGENTTDSLVPETARKVKVETKYTVSDALINIFTIWVSIETFTVEVYEVK